MKLEASAGFWTETEIISTESPDPSYSPAIATDGAGNVHIVWTDETNYGNSGSDVDIFSKFWNVTTGTWTGHVNMTDVVSTESTDASSDPTLAVDGSGNVHVAWCDSTDYGGAGTDSDIFYKRWNTTSKTWSTTEVISDDSTDQGGSPTIAIDIAGNVHLAWSDQTDIYGAGTHHDIFYKVWNASISTWSGYINSTDIISTESVSEMASRYPSIAVDGMGNVHVTWMENNVSHAGTEHILYKRWNITTHAWGGYINATDKISTESTREAKWPDLAVDGSGNVHLVWTDETYPYLGTGQGNHVFYKLWNATSKTWSVTDVISPVESGSSVYPAVAVDGAGSIHVVWSDGMNLGGSGDDIFCRHWNVTSNSWTSIEFISTESSESSYQPAITVDSGGIVHVVWYELPEFYLGDVFYKKYGIDDQIRAPLNLQAAPSGWTNINSFNLTWTNPPDLSGIVGAYYKLSSAPISATDGTYVAGNNITEIRGIYATSNGTNEVYVWLRDAVGNVEFNNYSTTILYLNATPPTPPQINDWAVSSNYITIIWALSPEPDILQYNVYRSPRRITNISGLTPIATVGGNRNSYTDSGLPDGKYYYVITAVDALGEESVMSNSIMVKINFQAHVIIIIVIVFGAVAAGGATSTAGVVVLRRRNATKRKLKKKHTIKGKSLSEIEKRLEELLPPNLQKYQGISYVLSGEQEALELIDRIKNLPIPDEEKQEMLTDLSGSLPQDLDYFNTSIVGKGAEEASGIPLREAVRIHRTSSEADQDRITDSPNLCQICHRGFPEDYEYVLCLECHAKFHRNCILDWLERKRSCPVCMKGWSGWV